MQFIPDDQQLTIKLEGFEQVWALKRRVVIPVSAIEEVDYVAQQPVMKDLWGYWRVPGTSIPWRFLAGSYVHNKKWEFWYLRMKQAGALIITLKPGVIRYEKIRVTCTPEIAQGIADWWQGQKIRYNS